ncbi:MFS transporter [Rhodococcus sp. 077-4]|uniref:MFS transporter n=1 Tax=Rhodococcus sp. 077-4 TaxID=2789271 RepID=UPI0039F467E8
MLRYLIASEFGLTPKGWQQLTRYHRLSDSSRTVTHSRASPPKPVTPTNLTCSENGEPLPCRPPRPRCVRSTFHTPSDEHCDVFTFVVPVSEAVAEIAASEVPGVLLASGIGGVVGVLAAGRISDRWPLRALPVTVVTFAVILGVTGFAHAPMAYVLLAVLWGVMIGMLPVVLQANVMRAASENFRPLAGSVLVTVLNLGVGLGAGLGSLVSSHDGLHVLPFIAAATTALAIVPLIIFRLLRRNAQPPASTSAGQIFQPTASR